MQEQQQQDIKWLSYLNSSICLSAPYAGLLPLVLYLGLIVRREDFGPTFDRSVVILEILLNLFDWMRASIWWSVQRLTWNQQNRLHKGHLSNALSHWSGWFSRSVTCKVQVGAFTCQLRSENKRTTYLAVCIACMYVFTIFNRKLLDFNYQ